jgi:hypothetical protein
MQTADAMAKMIEVIVFSVYGCVSKSNRQPIAHLFDLYIHIRSAMHHHQGSTNRNLHKQRHQPTIFT